MSESERTNDTRNLERTLEKQAAEIKRLGRIIFRNMDDWAETDTHCRAQAATVLGPERVEGDSNHTPDISEIVDMLVARIEVLQREEKPIEPMWDELMRLQTLRNAALHGEKDD
jgi:hypothetical protein